MTDVASVEWIRTTGRTKQEFHYDPLVTGRLYIATDWDYGPDQKWMESVTRLYEALVRRVKKQTVKVQDGWPRYISRRFGPEFLRGSAQPPGTVRKSSWTG